MKEKKKTKIELVGKFHSNQIKGMRKRNSIKGMRKRNSMYTNVLSKTLNSWSVHRFFF